MYSIARWGSIKYAKEKKRNKGEGEDEEKRERKKWQDALLELRQQNKSQLVSCRRFLTW